jgi:hypothetical protein
MTDETENEAARMRDVQRIQKQPRPVQTRRIDLTTPRVVRPAHRDATITRPIDVH